MPQPIPPLNELLQDSLERNLLRDLIAYATLMANAIRRHEDVPAVQQDSVLAWAQTAHDWLQTSHLDVWGRTSARLAADRLISQLSGIKGL